jgi:adenylate cyclase
VSAGAKTAADRLPDESWPLAPVVHWLVREGRLIATLPEFVDAVCDKLTQAGLSLWRFRIGFRTIHPQLLAMGVLWVRGSPTRLINARHGIEQSDDYVGSPIQHVFEKGVPLRRRLDRLDATKDHGVLHSIARAGATDYLALPLRFSQGAVNVLILATDAPAGFADDEVNDLTRFADYLAPVIEVFATRQLAVSLLETYVGPRTGQRVLQGTIKRGDGECIFAAMWFSDLRDFTPLTESLPIPELLQTLNDYFELVAAAVTARGGEILRFIGDAMLIVFPSQDESHVADACTAALESAQDAFSALATLNHRRRRAGKPEIRFGVGLHVGEVIYGNVGAPNRLDFTVMGPAVNRTARLESLTKAVDTPLLMSAEFTRHIGVPVRSLGHHAMKGVATPQEVFSLARAFP